MSRKSFLVIGIASASLAVLVGTAMSAQDKYSLKTSSGIAFSDFRGYEGWEVVSSARTDEVLKVIVGNPTMIAAYKAGAPGNGKPFPDGSKIAKLQWKFKKSTEAPFVVDVPDTFSQAFMMEKDSKRFPSTTGGWGYALFNYDPASDTFAADPSPADCGNACHQAVKAKGYIFHPYQKR
jgi:hypothetical protein